MNPYLLILAAAGAAVGYLVDGKRGAAIGGAVVVAYPVWTSLSYRAGQAEASRRSVEGQRARQVPPTGQRPPVSGYLMSTSYALAGWRALSAAERARFIQKWGGDPSLPWRGAWESQASCRERTPGRDMAAECESYDAGRWCREVHPRECPTFRGV